MIYQTCPTKMIPLIFLSRPQEHIEVISTEDERIKIIGEELANDTGRAIFGKTIPRGVEHK